ncbi:MAG: hypothetical protein QJR08_04235 [Bacillota bacterium]|nr:hypothetical protein [Bacillota bacterium]
MRLRIAVPHAHEPAVLLDKPRKRVRPSEPMSVQPPEVVEARLAELRANPERRRRLWLMIDGYRRYRAWPIRHGPENPFARLGA